MLEGFDFSWLYGNGWVGVIIGLLCFGMGFYKGRFDQNHLSMMASIIIEDLVERRMIKTRKVFNQETGEWDIDLLEYDEE